MVKEVQEENGVKGDTVPGNGNEPFNPWKHDAELITTSASFDKEKNKQADINIPIIFNGNTLSSITNNSLTLTKNIDYTMDNNNIIIKANYLSTLPPGTYNFIFNFDSGSNKTLQVTVTDSTIITPPVNHEQESNNTEIVKDSINVSITNSSETITNTINPSITLKTLGNNNFDLTKLKIRYYYTSDSNVSENIWLDTAAISYTTAPWYADIKNNTKATIYKINDSKTLADSYTELIFSDSSILNASASLTLSFRISKEDWSSFDQSNDFSYNNVSNIVVYYDGKTLTGLEP